MRRGSERKPFSVECMFVREAVAFYSRAPRRVCLRFEVTRAAVPFYREAELLRGLVGVYYQLELRAPRARPAPCARRATRAAPPPLRARSAFRRLSRNESAAAPARTQSARAAHSSSASEKPRRALGRLTFEGFHPKIERMLLFIELAGRVGAAVLRPALGEKSAASDRASRGIRILRCGI